MQKVEGRNMPKVINKLTPEEKKSIDNIDAKYMPKLEVAHRRMNEAMEAWRKAYDKKDMKALEIASKEQDAASSVECALNTEWLNEREKITKEAEKRTFNSFNGDANKILDMLKNEVPRHIALFSAFAGNKPTQKDRNEQAKQTEAHKKEICDTINYIREELKTNPDDEELKKSLKNLEELLETGQYNMQLLYDTVFSDENLKEHIFTSMKQYLDYLKVIAPDIHKEALSYIESCIDHKEEMYARVIGEQQAKIKQFPAIITKAPENYISTTDKPSNTLFSADNDVIYSHKLLSIGINSKGSKKEIKTMLSVDMSELEKEGVKLSSKRISPFDREVHDAILTLNVEGGNEFVSLPMIYSTMTGKPCSRLNPKQKEMLSESILRLMHTTVEINASEEASIYGFDQFKYHGQLIAAEMATATINGNTTSALHIFREPVLYSYASNTNKISRAKINLLDSPISKTEETIILQGYLLRRISTMKNKKNKMSKTIVYDTIYKQLDIKAASDNALRKKKLKVREKIYAILNYWKKQKFIIDYTENTKATEKYSITIKI